MESARSQGALRTNSLVKFRRYLAPNRRALLEIQELGNADALLKKPSHFTAEAQQLLEQGTIPTEDGWGGWLGQYQIKLCEAASQLMNQKAQERSRPRDNRLGR